MNSLFILFDGFCAGVMMGKTVSIFSPATGTQSRQRSGSGTENTNDKQVMDGIKGTAGKPKKIKLAPEFDGLNVFDKLIL